MKQQVQAVFAEIVKKLGIDDAEIVVDFPESALHGEYTTNIAMVLSKRLKAPPREVAQKIIDQIKSYQTTSEGSWIDRVEIAGPGFINLYVTVTCFGSVIESVLNGKEAFGKAQFKVKSEKLKVIDLKKSEAGEKNIAENFSGKNEPKNVDNMGKTSSDSVDSAGKESASASTALRGNTKTIMVEFAHPNTHKAFHIGHLRNITTGETIVRLLESQGNRVIRANYQGDVGMHIAKALYALLEIPNFKSQISTMRSGNIKEKVEFLGKAYAAGSAAYEGDEESKKKIGDINKQIYAKDPAVYDLYRETRQWSLDYFEAIYKRVYTHYDRYYFESEMYEKGTNFVLEGVKNGVFEESNGAVIFPGEKFGLHNRVFITSEGNATYEGKEIALGRLQFDEYDPDTIIHCVGPEQAGYFQVLFKALEQMFPETTAREYHLAYGWVKLKEGKMSSRTGNVVLGEWLIEEVKKAILEIMVSNTSKQIDIDKDSVAEALAIGAIKYAFLKVSTNQEIAFDLKESINTNGDSGPYLMYTYARSRSVLRKVPNYNKQTSNNWNLDIDSWNFNEDERLVARFLLQFPDIVKAAADNYAPNILCTYLFQLAQAFNVFYGKNQIVQPLSSSGLTGGSASEKTDSRLRGNDNLRVELTAATAQVIKNGLYLLGINVLERM